MTPEDVPDDFCNLAGEIRGYGVSDLMVLRCSWAAEEVIVREGLETRGLADGEAATLRWIIVNVVVAVF